MKEGFTLVELSIALVIIGLLIAGVLVGQSLVESAKTNKLVNNLRQYEIAVTQFYLKFKYYPGDAPIFTPAGNGDQDVGLGINGCVGTYTDHERSQAWAHLSQSGLLKASYTPHQAQYCGGTQVDDNSDESLAGIVWPYTTLNERASLYSGYDSKAPIEVARLYSFGNYSNFFFILRVNPIDVMALGNKMGIKSSLGLREVGLVVPYGGAGYCIDDNGTAIDCADPNAAYGSLAYFLPGL